MKVVPSENGVWNDQLGHLFTDIQSTIEDRKETAVKYSDLWKKILQNRNLS